MAKKNGRPLDYPTPELLISKTQEYLQSVGREQTKLPTIEGLALHLDLNKSNLYAYVKRYPEFQNYIKKVADMQKEQLMNDGMYGGKEVNAAMAIFLLKVVHGMKENDPTTLVQVNVQPILGKLDAK